MLPQPFQRSSPPLTIPGDKSCTTARLAWALGYCGDFSWAKLLLAAPPFLSSAPGWAARAWACICCGGAWMQRESELLIVKEMVPGSPRLCLSLQPWSLTASRQLHSHLGEQRLSSTSARQKIAKKASTAPVLLGGGTLMLLISSSQDFLERAQCWSPSSCSSPACLMKTRGSH